MRKIFTFALAFMASIALMAETESNPTSDISSNDNVVGTSYSIDGSFVAGLGGTKAGDMQTKGIKFRLNKTADGIANAVKFDVTEGYVIENIAFCGHVNDGSKTSTITQVLADGVDIQATPVDLPTKSSSVSFNFDLNASESVILVFSGTGTQANIEYTVTYSEGEPSTDPVLSANKESLTLAATAAKTTDEAAVKFSGKNLTPGTYDLAVPAVAGLTVNPASVTVGEDGKLNADVTVAYTSTVDVEAAAADIVLTIGELSATVAVNYSASMAMSFLTQSFNIEQLVMDNGTKYNIKAAFDAANVEYNNIDALDSLNDDFSKTNRNYAFLGLKMKKADASLACWIQAGTTVNVKFGNVGAEFKVFAGNREMTLGADSIANTAPESANVLSFNAQEDTYLRILCNSTKTLVVKQIMLNENIAQVTLPEPSVYTVTCEDAENGSVTLANGNKKGSFAPGETVEVVLHPDEGFLTTSLTYNGNPLYKLPDQPIIFTMPAEPVSVIAVFDTGFPAGIDNNADANSTLKLIRNGQLYILRNGIYYNLQGNCISEP